MGFRRPPAGRYVYIYIYTCISTLHEIPHDQQKAGTHCSRVHICEVMQGCTPINNSMGIQMWSLTRLMLGLRGE